MENKKNDTDVIERSKDSCTDEHEARRLKLKAMQDAGIDPWPIYKNVDFTCVQALKDFSENSDKKYCIAGRLVSIREHGKTIFANVQDRSGKLQLYIRKDLVGDELFSQFKQWYDLGDIVWCNGSLFKTKMGEITLKVQEVTLLSKCLHPLPEKYHGLADVQHRYRQRYLDLISNEESRTKFKHRSSIVQSVRQFLLDNDFLEVETPMLHPIAGGAAARPFMTHHNAYDMDLYLRIAPELYLKRLVIGGFERVFEVNRNFRNEGVSTKHNPEFTMLEFYMAHGDYKKGMEFTEQLFKNVVDNNFDSTILPFKGVEIDYSKPFDRLSVYDSLIKIAGFTEKQIDESGVNDLLKKNEVTLLTKLPSYGEKLWALFEECVEDKLLQPTFITKHPIEVSPLAKRHPEDPYAVARFELFAGGIEIANGFSELNDPIDQAERFKKQIEMGEAGDEEAHSYDADYIKALEYGLPPTVGVGIGIDRLVMLLTDTQSIKDVILFPTMKPVHE
jgi:lysyl-tRNA synthetase class 2